LTAPDLVNAPTAPTTSGPVAATANNQDVATGSNPLVGASAASTGQNDGSVLSAGALSGDQTGSVSVNTPTGTLGQ
jgi:hypothetical protein